MKNISILICLCLVYVGCNYFSPENNRQRVEESFQYADSVMAADFNHYMDTLRNRYKIKINTTNDTISKNKTQDFYSSLISTLNYIDSVKMVINREKQNDNNYVKTVFIVNGLADSIFKKINLTFDLADDVIINDSLKTELHNSRINILGEPDLDQRKNQYFGMNTVEGSRMILFGFETEIYKIGVLTLGEANR